MFNGVDYCELRGDKHKYTQPKLKVGDTIKLLYNDEDPRPKLPGERRMTRGNYVVQQIRTGFSSKDSLVYVLVKNGAKYKWGGTVAKIAFSALSTGIFLANAIYTFVS